MGTVLMKVTFSDVELARIDAVRGQTPRATWVRLAAVALSSEGVSGSPPARPPAPKSDRSPELPVGNFGFGVNERGEIVKTAEEAQYAPPPPPKAERLEKARAVLGKPPLDRPIVQKRTRK